MPNFWAQLDTKGVVSVFKLERHADIKAAEKDSSIDQVFGPFKSSSFSAANHKAAKAFGKELKRYYAVLFLSGEIKVSRYYTGSQNAIDRAFANPKVAQVMHPFKASDLTKAQQLAKQNFYEMDPIK